MDLKKKMFITLYIIIIIFIIYQDLKILSVSLWFLLWHSSLVSKHKNSEKIPNYEGRRNPRVNEMISNHI